MTKTNQNINIHSGDTHTITVTVTDENGDAKNLTDATITYKAGDTIEKTLGNGIEISNAAGGIFLIALLPVDTASLDGLYPHEAEVTDSNGVVSTIFIGNLFVTKDLIT